jgi:uncharacterized protein (DUF608 family)
MTGSRSPFPRREFMKRTAVALGSMGVIGLPDAATADTTDALDDQPRAARPPRTFDGTYRGTQLNRVAFPLGGIGAGMLCLEGLGALSEISIRNNPDVFNEPCLFAAVHVRGATPAARVLEGPVPGWKVFGARGSAQGDGGSTFGLPRFAEAAFRARFPFGVVTLRDPEMPITAEITGWSPFIPGDADNSSLPVAALEYRLTNTSRWRLSGVFSFNARNFLPLDSKDRHGVRAAPNGFTLWSTGPADLPWRDAAFQATVDDTNAKTNCAWFRGDWWDPLTMAWKDVEAGNIIEHAPLTSGEASPGGSVFVPFDISAGGHHTVTLRLAWYAPQSNLRMGQDPVPPPASMPIADRFYRPWYSGRFADIDAVGMYWRDKYQALRKATQQFRDAFYDTTLPSEVIEAVAANLAILKSPTLLRQTDGRLWAYEGCADANGCCSGTCTHVWNYAQAIPHLFPALERTLRETEFGPSQDDRGHQAYRAALPIRPLVHDEPAAADGQLGGIMRVHREWRISGDTAWLKSLWPKVRQSLDYCIATWDPDHKGWLVEPHHNTYDIEFWGPDGMCTSIYLGALQAAVLMGTAIGDDVSGYATLRDAGITLANRDLFNGEYYIQHVEWKNLHAATSGNDPFGLNDYSPEARAVFDAEGPKYQYGSGCLSDGVIGAWLGEVTGVGPIMDPAKVKSHLAAIHRYNFKSTLSDHANPQRPSYALGTDGGVLLCTWPHGGALSLPFVYSDEVWTGIEYQVASHMILSGMVEPGLEVVRTCRARYDGRVRNPFDEYECGHWYARALSSYALLQALSGARYDAVDRTLHLQPAIRGDFRAFLAAATGYGTVGVRNGKPFLDVRSGTIPVDAIRYQA